MFSKLIGGGERQSGTSLGLGKVILTFYQLATDRMEDTLDSVQPWLAGSRLPTPREGPETTPSSGIAFLRKAVHRCSEKNGL